MSVKPWDLLKPSNYADSETSISRMLVCEDCSELQVTKTCKQCGCFMPAKTRLREATCPLSKWGN